MTKSKKEDKALYFASDYKRSAKPVNLEKTSRSVQLHVEKIAEANVGSVLDLGCGAGGILLALQNAGIGEIHGIDASPEAIELMKKRFEKFGSLENTSFTVGDIVQFDPPTVDAVSSHSVICCHPNAIGIINTATQKDPKMVVITFPMDNLRSKLVIFLLNRGLWIAGRFKKSIRGRKSYVHSTELVNATFEENGYKLVFTDETSMSQTLVYEKL
ncbi:MAG: methyltransferase domain-containing protein [Candidatus Heimdallarchaeota archaeon]|nr:methyltransferase domain-containing protein [Candidatus Heimdallarchaeota archaeon]